jgi:hypothetical protein
VSLYDDDFDYEPCEHDCFEAGCDEDGLGDFHCLHQHCGNCGGCGCPGYCDDYQTYNLRPDETGGPDD